MRVPCAARPAGHCGQVVALRAGILAALLATLGCAQAPAADLQPAVATLCTPNELVAFSCLLGPELVSPCATQQSGVISALSYREGQPGRLTRSYLASVENDQRFRGTVSALAPRALVRQVWFERDGLKVLLSECVGGECPQQAAQAVWRGDQLLSVRRCHRSADDRAWFSRKLVKFGANTASSRAAIPLLQLDDIDNGIGIPNGRQAAAMSRRSLGSCRCHSSSTLHHHHGPARLFVRALALPRRPHTRIAQDELVLARG